jgi:SAM-dependent methyltransferase
VEVVSDYARLAAADRILEVGAGTGKATRQFAAGDHPIVALEPSAEMAAVARITCGGLPLVSVVEAEFESWPLPPEPFKLLISAQAWHWIDPELRYAKARAALKPGGALAAFWNAVDWESAPLGPVLAEAYQQAAPEFAVPGPMHPLTRAATMIPDWDTDIGAADGLGQPEVRSFPWRQRYGAREYVRLLSTHSDHIVLEAVVRERLFQRIAEVIGAHGGELEVPYVAHLCLARAR